MNSIDKFFRASTSLILLAASFNAMADAKLDLDNDWRSDTARGKKFLETNQLEPAQVCFEQALHKIKKSPDKTLDDEASCYSNLASVMQMENMTDEVIPQYKKALKLLREAHGELSVQTLPVLKAMGDVYFADTEFRDASERYTDGLKVLNEHSLQNTFEYARYQYWLGLTNFRAGYFDKAEPLFDSSLTLAMSLNGENSTDFFQELLSDYIDLLRKSREYQHVFASQLQNELLKDTVRSFSYTKSVDTSSWHKLVSSSVLDSNRIAPPANTTQTNVAPQSVPQDESQFAREIENGGASAHIPAATNSAPLPAAPAPGAAAVASAEVPKQPDKNANTLSQINRQREEFYERMVAIDIKSLGVNHPSTARDLTGLANVFISQNRLTEAQTLLERALKIFENAYGVDPLLVKRTKALLTLVMHKQNGGVELTADALAYTKGLTEVPLAAQQLEIALRLNYLALLLFSEGKTVQAEKVYAWALPATVRACGEQSAMASACLLDYARVLRTNGHLEKAQKYEESANLLISNQLAKAAVDAIPW